MQNQNRHESKAKFTTTVNGEKKTKILNLRDTMRNLIFYLDNSQHAPDAVINGLLGLKRAGLNIEDLKDNNFYIILDGKNKTVPRIKSDDIDEIDEYIAVPSSVYIFLYPHIFKKPFRDYIYKIINDYIYNLADETAEDYIRMFKDSTHLNADLQYMMAECPAGIFMDIISEFQ